MKFYLIGVLMFLLFLSEYSVAQKSLDEDTLNITRTVIVDGDTIPNVSIEEVVIFPRLIFKSRYRARRYRKLIRDVKKAGKSI